jgi:mannose-6-phosphate isomerase
MEKSERPWGTYEVIDEGIGYKVKIIKVNPGQKLSYQFHNFREEKWTCISGSGTIVLNDSFIPFNKGDMITIPQGSKHRVMSKEIGLIFIEIQLGTYLGEDDITRIEDIYGRVN